MAYTTIDDPTDYFNTKLYTGTGSSLALTGIGHQPDFVWIKPRNDVRGHHLFNSVIGVGKSLVSNEANDEESNAQTLTAFGSDGFTVGTSNDVNKANNTHVAWNWKAGGSASSNTDGSITSTVSANTTSGFSIVSYTGTGSTGTVGHGLGATPGMIIIKERNNATSWIVYHHKNTSAPATDYLLLNSTQATDDYADYFNDTEPTSSVFTIDTAGDINGSSDTYIAYCFAEKKGFSKFGSYIGTGNADGPFIHLGFKPAFVMFKRTDTTNNWHIGDNKRLNPYNPLSTQLYPNLNNAETEQADQDFLSNGFKIRTQNNFQNSSGGTYIYMAFAENPFVTSTGIPTTAR